MKSGRTATGATLTLCSVWCGLWGPTSVLGASVVDPVPPAATAAEVPAQDTIPVQAPAEAAVQPKTAPSGNRLIEEVIVTAQKREENLADVPISVNAFSMDALDARGVVDVRDLALAIPGFTLTEQIGYAITYIRGVGTDAFLLADPSVATYVDGIYLPIAAGAVQAFGNIERIEVLKGPQGTLFGRNALGGAINIITKAPSLDEAEMSVQTSYSRYNNTQNRAYVGVPLSDTLAIGVSGVYNAADHYVDGRVDGQPLPRQTERAARVRLRWAPTESLDIVLTGVRSENRGAAGNYGPNAEPSQLLGAIIPAQDPYAGSLNDPVFNNNDNELIYAQVNLATDWFDTKLMGSRQHNVTAHMYDFDGSPLPLVTFEQGKLDALIKTAELQLVSNNDSWSADWLKWTAGAYYFTSRGTFDPVYFYVADTALNRAQVLGIPVPQGLLDALALLPVPTGVILPTGVIDTDSHSFYGQATAAITDWFSLTLGLRYQSEKRNLVESTSGLLNTDGSVVPIPGQNYSGNTDPRWKDTTTSFKPKVALEFRPWGEGGTLAYLSYQQAVKSSTFNVINLYDRPEKVEAEEITAYEAGVKTRLFDGLTSFSAAVFRYDIDQPQVQFLSLLAGGAVQFENAGSEKITGCEFDTLSQLFPDHVDGLALSLGGTILDAKYTEYLSASGYTGPGGIFTSNNDYSGKPIVRTPKFSGTATLSKSTDVSGGVFELAADYYYASKYYYLAQSTPDIEEPAHGILGARISYLYEPWNLRVTVFGKNITNTRYSLGKFGTDFGVEDFRAPLAVYGVRLNWEL